MVPMCAARRVLAVIVSSVVWCGTALAAPCVTATPACTELVPVSGGPAGVLVYRNHGLGTRNDAITNVLIVIHGAERDATLSFRISAAAAVLTGRFDSTLIIAPRFAANAGTACSDALLPNELNWNCDVVLGDWRGGGMAINDPRISTFNALDDILRAIQANDLLPNLRTVVIAGHSAGGQFATNYQMTNRVHEGLRVHPRYVAANAPAYAYPREERPKPVKADECPGLSNWPFGTSNRSGYVAAIAPEQLLRQTITRPITYLLGELDVQPISGGFYGLCEGLAQGDTRLERGVAFGKYMSESLGAKHSTVLVRGCAHSESCVFLSSDGLRALLPRQ